VIIHHPRTSAGECTLPPRTASPPAYPPKAPTPASGYSSPVQSRVYGTIVSVAGVPTVPMQRQKREGKPFPSIG
jgi:hypothetical protein